MESPRSEIDRLRRLAEEQLQQLEKQQQQLEKQQQRIDEQQQQLEEAEKAAELSTLQTLLQYFEGLHALHRSMIVVTDPSSTTQGDTTDPTGRIYPRLMAPSLDFKERQQDVWKKVSSHHNFFSRRAFPSQHQLDFVRSKLNPISSEVGLRNFEHRMVEDPVESIIGETYNNPNLRELLGLNGTVTFEDHLNLGEVSDAAFGPRSQKPRRGARGKGGNADRFCVYKTQNGRRVPIVAIEYKPPHKLSVDELVLGLESEIQPERDVIHKDDTSPAFYAKALVAAVITQLFSYMVYKGTRYGYICTGEAFCFLRISDDPAVVYYALCVPDRDVRDDDANWYQFTAVAQVYAFLLQAVSASPPPQPWYDEAEKLKQWDREYDNILSKIPLSVRKRKEPHQSPYKARSSAGLERSPIKTRSRSRCKLTTTVLTRKGGDDDGDDADNDDNYNGHDATSPTTNASVRAKARTQPARRGKNSSSQGIRKHGQLQVSTLQTCHRDQDLPQGTTQPSIEERPYCTHKCLLGLTSTGQLDPNCPNAHAHGDKHIGLGDFLCLVEVQLAEQRGHDADCAPLFLFGLRGMLFKVRLTGYGYTFTAKGVELSDRKLLQHECDIYRQLQPIQGKHVPVCLGMVVSDKPWRAAGRACRRFLFLSWSGNPLEYVHPSKEKAEGAIEALEATHGRGVLHGDVHPNNFTYDAETGQTMLIDFGKSRVCGRPPLEEIKLNGRNRQKTGKRKRQDELDWEFELDLELQEAKSSVGKWSAPPNIQDKARGYGAFKAPRGSSIHSYPAGHCIGG